MISIPPNGWSDDPIAWWSVDYLRAKRQKEHSQLKEKLNNIRTESREYKSWEVAMKEVQAEFDLNKYFND